MKAASLWRSVLRRIDARHQLRATLFSEPFCRCLYPHSGTVDEFLHIHSITKQVLYLKSWHSLEYKYLKFLWFCLFLSLCKLVIITGALCREVYLWKTSLQTNRRKVCQTMDAIHVLAPLKAVHSSFCHGKDILVLTVRVNHKCEVLIFHQKMQGDFLAQVVQRADKREQSQHVNKH